MTADTLDSPVAVRYTAASTKSEEDDHAPFSVSLGRRRREATLEQIIPAPSGKYPGGMPEYISKAVELTGGTLDALAQRLGLSRSRLSYYVNQTGMPGIHTCLQLALLTGDDPKDVLIMAGHDGTAAIVHELYGERSSDDAAVIRMHQFEADCKLREAIAAAVRARAAIAYKNPAEK